MVRLSVPAGERLELVRTLDVQPGGAEGNAVTALARLGRSCAWVGALPDNSLGRLIANRLKLAGVDLGGVKWVPDGRAGLYFLEFAGPPRNSEVIYDRADSCAANLAPEQINWANMMDTRHFHVSGITPALSEQGLACTQRAFIEASERNITTSLDVNFRAKMWSPERARSALLPLMPQVNVLFCGEEDARTVFGLMGNSQEILHKLSTLVPSGTAVMSSGAHGIWAQQSGEVYFQEALPVEVVDRLGAGDAMAAGILHGYLNGNLIQGMKYGALLASMILTQHGDMLVATCREIEELMQSGGGALAR